MTQYDSTEIRGPAKRTCGHHGCMKKLYRGYSTYDSGFCKEHGGQHKGRATVAPRASLPQEVARDGIREFYAPALAGMQSSTVDPKLVRVSLPKEPWL